MGFKSKRGDVTFIVSGVVVLILSFIIMMQFVGTTKDVANQTQDSACRALISLQSNDAYKLAKEGGELGEIDSFLEAINKKCFVDNIDVNNEKEVFKTVGDEMVRCWYRYGEGEYDFLSNFGTTGNWCFLCGTVEFDNVNGEQPYKYSEFISWAENEKNKCYGVGSCNKSQTYASYMNLKYYDVNNDELEKIGVEINSFLMENQNAPEYKDVIGVLVGQYAILQDLKMKQISTTDKNYIVYRFNRVDKDFEQSLADAGDFAYNSMIASTVATVTVNVVLSGGIGVFKGVKTLIISPVKFVQNLAKIAKLTGRIRFLIKSTKEVDEVAEVFVSFSGLVDDLPKIVKQLENIDPNYAKSIEEIYAQAKSLGINNFDEIGESNLNNAQKLVKLFINKQISNNQIITKLYGKGGKYAKEIDDLKSLESDLNNYISKAGGDVNTLNDIDKKSFVDKSKDYLKRMTLITATTAAAGGVAGGVVGYNYNDNSNQYVDIMTQEQYYRLCGTQRFEN